MIESLSAKEFTVFSDVRLQFGKDLNVFVGENGTGKSHALKLIYSLLSVLGQGAVGSKEATPGKTYLEGAIARKLLGVFRPDQLGRLTQRRQGRARSEVELHGSDIDLALHFSSQSKTEVQLSRLPKAWLGSPPIFVPTRELLSIFPGFVSLYENTAIPFEETWRDTCLMLDALPARGPREKSVREALAPLEKILGATVVLESGRFYLDGSGAKTEIHLVAEGLRKLAMIARLIATGSLLNKGYLFWDEPEANLNPKLIKEIAAAIVRLAKGGIQTFVATHSLFLLRELYLLQDQHSLDGRFFGMRFSPEGEVVIEGGATIDEIGEITALREEASQAERYLALEMEKGER